MPTSPPSSRPLPPLPPQPLSLPSSLPPSLAPRLPPPELGESGIKFTETLAKLNPFAPIEDLQKRVLIALLVRMVGYYEAGDTDETPTFTSRESFSQYLKEDHKLKLSPRGVLTASK